MRPQYFEPLRPNRYYSIRDQYEFTHGTNSVCVYDINTLQFIREIEVGIRPDCHATTCDNRYLYIACQTGLYCISQESLEVVAVLDTGHVYGTNMMPDGDTMMLHDAFGGILVIKNIQNPKKAYIYKKLQITKWNEACITLGGKGNFIDHNRYYIMAGWDNSQLFCVDMENDYSHCNFTPTSPLLFRSDDLVVNAEETLAVAACYGDKGYFSVVDIKNGKVLRTIPSGRGTCGLTMSADKRYVFASNDSEDSITRLDMTDFSTKKFCCYKGFEELGVNGCIQGITMGVSGSVYVYDCSGAGAIVEFMDFDGEPGYVVSAKNGKSVGLCKDNENHFA